MNFNAEYHNLNKYEVSIITEIVKDNNIPVVTMNELEKAIKSINKGKAADIYGLTIEHIFNAGVGGGGEGSSDISFSPYKSYFPCWRHT